MDTCPNFEFLVFYAINVVVNCLLRRFDNQITLTSERLELTWQSQSSGSLDRLGVTPENETRRGFFY